MNLLRRHAILAALALSPATRCQENAGLREDRETWNRIFRRTEESGVKWQANEFLTEVVAQARAQAL